MRSKFSKIFKVFSRRPESSLKTIHEIPVSTRNRILLWISEVFSNERSEYGSGDYRTDFWKQIHRFLQYRHGKIHVSSSRNRTTSPMEDTINFLYICSGNEFIDFIEYIFRVECLFHVALPEDQLLEEINELLQQDDLPYYITDFVKETEREKGLTYIKTVEYPKVIIRENEVIHKEMIVPTLTLLQQPEFKVANSEYLEALKDYRKNDLEDCLTKCCSSFESVMKIICERNGWSYNNTDTTSKLVKILLNNMSLDNYFEPVLMIVATLRNRLSSSHGGGVNPKKVPRHLAKYALNITAASIILLIGESEKK